MLTAVWVAVIVAAAFWVIGVCAAVYLLIKLARLVSQTASAVAGLRERGDLAIDRANAAIDLAGDQIARTDAITASMDEVTANMADLTGRVTALAPLERIFGTVSLTSRQWGICLLGPIVLLLLLELGKLVDRHFGERTPPK